MGMYKTLSRVHQQAQSAEEAKRKQYEDELKQYALQQQHGGMGKGAVTGAAIGSSFAPGVGTAWGAGIGGTLGLISEMKARQKSGQSFWDALGGSFSSAPGGAAMTAYDNPMMMAQAAGAFKQKNDQAAAAARDAQYLKTIVDSKAIDARYAQLQPPSDAGLVPRALPNRDPRYMPGGSMNPQYDPNAMTIYDLPEEGR